MEDKKVSKKEAEDIVNGGAFIDKIVTGIESRVGRLVGAMHQPNKDWLTYERGVALYKRLSSVITTAQAAQTLIEAHIPTHPKAPPVQPVTLNALLGGLVGHRDCNSENCPVHGPAVAERNRNAS